MTNHTSTEPGIPATPHTQTQQNANPGRPDLQAYPTDVSAGTADDPALDRTHEGEQSGTNRDPNKLAGASGKSKLAQPDAAFEGSVSTRTPGGATQGITNRSSDEESARQQKVVKDRPDAQAGVNHNR